MHRALDPRTACLGACLCMFVCACVFVCMHVCTRACACALSQVLHALKPANAACMSMPVCLRAGSWVCTCACGCFCLLQVPPTQGEASRIVKLNKGLCVWNLANAHTSPNVLSSTMDSRKTESK